jgi:hypothetical protein
MDELKPCPFCGKAELQESSYGVDDGDDTGHMVDVVYCPGHCVSAEKSVWQTRPIEDRLQGEVDLAVMTISQQSERIEILRNRVIDLLSKNKELLEWQADALNAFPELEHMGEKRRCPVCEKDIPKGDYIDAAGMCVMCLIPGKGG